MPGIAALIEHTAIASLVSTLRQTASWMDQDSTLPIGLPQLMMGFTADGQLKPDTFLIRDSDIGIKTADVRKAREDLASTAQPDPGADAWKDGTAKQLGLTKTPLMNKR